MQPRGVCPDKLTRLDTKESNKHGPVEELFERRSSPRRLSPMEIEEGRDNEPARSWLARIFDKCLGSFRRSIRWVRY